MRIVGLIIAGLALTACSDLSATARVGAGLTAMTLCDGVFVQGRDPDEVRSSELGPDTDERLSWFQADVDREAGEVRASVRGLFGARAGYAPGVGCAATRPGAGAAPPVRFTANPADWPAGDVTSDTPIDGVDRDALIRLAEAAFRPGATASDPGTRSIVVIHQGRLILERHADGWNGVIPQYGASMSKTVSAALVGVLVGQGRLSLLDADLRPDWSDGRSAIRLEHLLRMESGLDFIEDYGGAADPANMLYVAESASEYAAEKALAVEPGTRWSYSSGDTNLLMAIAHDRSGLDQAAWNAFPRDALFAPLGMRGALFQQDAGGDFVGSTFVYASALDWARFGLLLAQDGVWNGRRILPEGWVAYMATPTALSGGEYGAQTWLRGAAPGGGPAPILEMRGYGGQYVTVLPETDTVIVRLGWNVDRSAWDQTAFLLGVLPTLGITAPLD